MKKPKLESGPNLRAFRESLGLTQLEFARALKFSVRKDGKSEGGYIEAMESGRRPISRLTKLLCEQMAAQKK